MNAEVEKARGPVDPQYGGEGPNGGFPVALLSSSLWLRCRREMREAVHEEKVEHPAGRGRSARSIVYALPGGWRVLVGRTEADNDRLSLKVARPGDWWFHVRGMPGSHVVLQGPPGEEPDRKTRESAAAIAAHHSKARGGGVVAVTCTRARYVTKPPGAKPGTVQVRKEVVLKVRPAPGEIVPEREGDAGVAPTVNGPRQTLVRRSALECKEEGRKHEPRTGGRDHGH